MITQTINLNLIPGSPLPRINVSQYDNGSRTLQFNLYNGVSPYEIPSGASVYIVGTKADKTGFEYACTFDGPLVSVDITDQMTVFAGEVQSELQIRQSDEILGTANFIINVERAALSDDTQISETDIPIIQRIPEIVEETEANAELAHKWATYGSSSEQPSATNNAKYYKEQCELLSQGALYWKGSVTFANIPTSGMKVGDYYNITNDFTTDSRFTEGAGIKCAAGTNIVWGGSKWDIPTPNMYASSVKYDNTTSGLSATNVQSAIDEIDADKMTWGANSILGAKNLIPYPYYETTKVQNGITFTDNGDGTVTANGTATANTAFYMNFYSQGTMGLKTDVAYRLNGVTGGSTSTYQIFISSFSGTTQKEIFFVTDDNTLVRFSKPFDGIAVYCRVVSGATVSNLIFKPMLRLAEDTDETFRPYAMTNKELTDNLNTTHGNYYGTCATAAATAAKVVTVDDNFKLAVGTTVTVKFTNTNTASNCTLNVNGTGAKSIWYNTSAYTGSMAKVNGQANRYTKYVYDGTYWVWMGQSLDDGVTTPQGLGFGYGTCATAESTVAKVVTLANYSLMNGGYVSVKFTNAVSANATMNINSKGAKPIYYHGSAITAGIIKAGDVATFIYNGSQYVLTGVDSLSTKVGALETKMGTSDISSIGDGTVTGGIRQLNSDLSEFSEMKSETQSDCSADWVQIGKVVTVYFGTLKTISTFIDLPLPHEGGSGATIPVTFRRSSDGAHLQGYFGKAGDNAVLSCPTNELCYATLSYVTV